MTVYIIKPSGITNFYKIGYTKIRNTEKDTRDYLYKRYRTSYGKNMEIMYLKTWKTDTIGRQKEQQMFELMSKYRNNKRDEIFICKYSKIQKKIPILEGKNIDTNYNCCTIL